MLRHQLFIRSDDVFARQQTAPVILIGKSSPRRYIRRRLRSPGRLRLPRNHGRFFRKSVAGRAFRQRIYASSISCPALRVITSLFFVRTSAVPEPTVPMPSIAAFTIALSPSSRECRLRPARSLSVSRIFPGRPQPARISNLMTPGRFSAAAISSSVPAVMASVVAEIVTLATPFVGML